MNDVHDVVVVGAGTMGAGIAQVAATHGCGVRLIDVSAEVLKRGLDGMSAQLDRSVQKGRLSQAQRDAILGRICTSSSIADVSTAQLVIEAVIEDLGVKTKVFQALDAATSREAVLATNTSSLRVSRIAAAVRRPGRVVGMHFFNPAPVMPLVEIICGDATDETAVSVAFEAARAWGKVPVRAKDTPGFIVNRVARGFYLEALRMLGEGVADVETIDRAMQALGGFRMGPFQLMDLVGLDVNYAVSCSVYEQSGRPARLAPHAVQQELVRQGRVGRKAGVGFYRYDVDPPEPAYGADVTPLQLPSGLMAAVRLFTSAGAPCEPATLAAAGERDRYVFTRVLATVMNEAALALEDGVATAVDIDTAMQEGTNYPKGPLAWAKQIGHQTVAATLAALNEVADDGRFAASRVFSR